MTEEWKYEELGQPRPPRRVVRVLIVLAVLVLGAIGVARVATAHSHRSPAAAATSESPSPTTPRRVSVPTPHAVGRPRARIPHFQQPPGCPRATDGGFACTTYRSLPAPLAHALRDLFPAITVDSVVTQVLRPTGPEPPNRGIWSRELDAHAHQVRIQLSISRREPGDDRSSLTVMGTRMTGMRFVLAQVVGHRYVIQLVARRARANPVPIARLAGLADDPRLVRL